jgi:hypothetical protein
LGVDGCEQLHRMAVEHQVACHSAGATAGVLSGCIRRGRRGWRRGERRGGGGRRHCLRRPHWRRAGPHSAVFLTRLWLLTEPGSSDSGPERAALCPVPGHCRRRQPGEEAGGAQGSRQQDAQAQAVAVWFQQVGASASAACGRPHRAEADTRRPTNNQPWMLHVHTRCARGWASHGATKAGAPHDVGRRRADWRRRDESNAFHTTAAMSASFTVSCARKSTSNSSVSAMGSGPNCTCR